MIAAFDGFDGYLFDLDGVLTPTAEVHMRAWQVTFDRVFADRGITPAYTSTDYYLYLDGKKRYDGVSSLFTARGVSVPWGDPDDGPEELTVCGVGNRKNAVFAELLRREGVAPYPGSVRLLEALGDAPTAVVSSSQNAPEVLRAARLDDRFNAVVDGGRATVEGLASKPAPDMFARGAALLSLAPARTVAFEDALSGVASAVAAGCGLVVGVDRVGAASALRAAGAHLIVNDLQDLL